MVDEVVKRNIEFIPFQSVGPFKLDKDICLFKHILERYKYESADEFGNEYYSDYDENLVISVRNNKIQSVYCYKFISVNGCNLIGLTVKDFQNIFQVSYVGDIEEYNFEEDGIPQYVYQFDDVGVQLWEKNGKIVTIIVNGKESYLIEPFY